MPDHVLHLDERGKPVLVRSAGHAEGAPRPATGALIDQAVERRDWVRSLAREFDDVAPQDVRDMRPVGARMPASELDRVCRDVRRQALDDLVDLLDQRHQGGLRARRTVRLQAPRGYVRRTVAGLSSEEVSSVSSRLRKMGWTADDVARVLPPRRS